MITYKLQWSPNWDNWRQIHFDEQREIPPKARKKTSSRKNNKLSFLSREQGWCNGESTLTSKNVTQDRFLDYRSCRSSLCHKGFFPRYFSKIPPPLPPIRTYLHVHKCTIQTCLSFGISGKSTSSVCPLSKSCCNLVTSVVLLCITFCASHWKLSTCVMSSWYKKNPLSLRLAISF